MSATIPAFTAIEDNQQRARGKPSASEKKANRKKIANRARHRLLSIRNDVDNFCRPTLQHPSLQGFPVVANERCGTWYAHPLMETPASCYFKSTDGHCGTWNFSLKRLNLNIIRMVAKHGACILMDASASKEIPDSFARTVPIWAAVMNRIAIRYRRELGIMPPMPVDDWDEKLHTPCFCVSNEESDQIRGLLDERVENLYRSRAIVDPSWLATTLVKPLRPYWITPDHFEPPSPDNDCFSVVCVNCSKVRPKFYSIPDNEAIYYTPGSADDHETWARQLSPDMFWDNVEQILDVPETEDETDNAIDVLIQREVENKDVFGTCTATSACLFDKVGNTNIFIGTRRAGRPPECWGSFDAVLNVTNMEYAEMTKCGPGCFYLQLPVMEGKRDRTELERWMAVGVVFLLFHAQQKRRILIHCAQGKDRSVAMAMALISIFCDLQFPLQWKSCFWGLQVECLLGDGEEDKTKYRSSGLSLLTVDRFLGHKGRDRLFEWVQGEISGSIMPLATKESLRIALLLIQQDREKADPTRSTMQKLNRFFMSKTSNDTL